MSKNKKKDTIFLWDKKSQNCLLELLIENNKLNGTNQACSWIKMTKEFNTLMNVEVDKEVLKNKHMAMKKLFALWKGLKHGSTGLGWSHADNTVLATPEWWEAKYKENAHYKKFRHQGIPEDVEELMERVYSGSGATRVNCFVPSQMNATQEDDVEDLTLDDHETYRELNRFDGIQQSGVDEFGVEQFVGVGGYMGNMLRQLDDDQLGEGSQYDSPTPTRRDSVVAKKRSCTPTGNLSKKKNSRQSNGAALYQQHVAMSCELSKTIINMIHQESIPATNKPDRQYTEGCYVRSGKFG